MRSMKRCLRKKSRAWAAGRDKASEGIRPLAKDAARATPFRGNALDTDAPLAILAELVFLAPSGGDDDRGLLANALRAVADESQMLSEALRAPQSIAKDLLLRCLQRIEQRALFALELDRRLRAASTRVYGVRAPARPAWGTRRAAVC